LNAQNINGETCLHIATFKGKDEVVKVLLDNKADLHVPNR
jgi:ankyrin repeat protein